MDAAATALTLTGQLRARGTPTRAAFDQAYLKSALRHYGTAVPDIRAIAKAFVRYTPALTHDELIALCAALWAHPVHEQRMLANELLRARQRLLGSADVVWLESLLRASKTWALVDELARVIVAGLVARDADLFVVLDRWVGDDDFWIRRSAVLGLSVVLREGRELDRFLRYADALLPETEFFIRKVLGWVAREVGQRDPAPISSWLRANIAGMNGVTVREAVKYLPDRADIMELYRTRRNSDG